MIDTTVAVRTQSSVNKQQHGIETTQHNVAIYYHPDGFDTGRKALMGRHAAGEQFLKALTRYGSNETLFAYAQKQEHFNDFIERISKSTSTSQRCQWISWKNWPLLGKAGCLFYPGPVLGNLAWQRRHIDTRLFSLCGITHTTATNAVMDGLGDLLVAPLQPWDAVICTSNSVKDMVSRVLNEQAAYVKDRFQLATTPKVPVQLPVIPLGVDCDQYAKPAGFVEQARSQWRQALNIAADDFVVLFFGRLSFHAKAHPMPLFRGLEETAKRSGKSIHLIMAGWFANDAIKDDFFKAAKAYCPSMKLTFVDGRKDEVRQTIWYAADVFSSFSDNVQETFGLAPLEAMAAGLPVVISDWDGYRETAQHGVSGFLVPTWLPPAKSAADSALQNAMGQITYDQYVGHQSQFCSVDIAACVDAFTTLLENPSLRKQMGKAGQQRAREVFDWRVIISQYQELWKELARLRGTALAYDARTAGTCPMPTRQDPTVLFQSYPTNTVALNTMVSATNLSDMDSFEQLRLVSMNTFVAHKIVVTNEVNMIFALLRKDGPQPLSSLLALVGSDRGKALMLTVLWLSKMGLLQLADP